jgi:hypothetical protein
MVTVAVDTAGNKNDEGPGLTVTTNGIKLVGGDFEEDMPEIDIISLTALEGVVPDSDMHSLLVCVDTNSQPTPR